MKKVSLFLFTVFCAAFFATEAFSITVPPLLIPTTTHIKFIR